MAVFAGDAGVSGYADGVGQAIRFYRPYDIAMDAGATRAVVADNVNCIIRIIDVTSGVVQVLAGNPRVVGYADGTGRGALFSYPSGVALSAAGNSRM